MLQVILLLIATLACRAICVTIIPRQFSSVPAGEDARHVNASAIPEVAANPAQCISPLENFDATWLTACNFTLIFGDETTPTATASSGPTSTPSVPSNRLIVRWSAIINDKAEHIRSPPFELEVRGQKYILVWQSILPLIVESYIKNPRGRTFVKRTETPPGGSAKGRMSVTGTRVPGGPGQTIMYNIEVAHPHGHTGENLGWVVWYGPPQ